jgi:hypothetical protein
MKQKINIVLFQPEHPRFHILNSYLEVIDSLVWGFEALGHTCTFRRNQVDYGALNIVFGWIPAFQAGLAGSFPPGSILVNLEQNSRTSLRGLTAMEFAAANFQIWDYAPGNIDRWREINPRFEPYLARISYAPTLTRFAGTREDIDIGYCGSLSPRRIDKIAAATATDRSNSVMYLAGFWGDVRDSLLARSKVLLNVSQENPLLTVFEIVRVSYYLANRKAVLCEARPDLEIEPDMAAVLRLETAERLPAACDELVADDALRRRYADDCFEAFAARDVRDVIRGFFG